MAPRPADQTLELPRAASAPPPTEGRHVVHRSRNGRGLQWALVLALVVAVVAATWQAAAAATARAELEALHDRVAAVENEVTALHAENEALRAGNEALRAENDALRAENGRPGASAEAPTVGDDALDALLPFLRDRFGDVGDLGGLGDFGDLLDDGLDELFNDGLDELGRQLDRGFAQLFPDR